jgi:hypothetical protein
MVDSHRLVWAACAVLCACGDRGAVAPAPLLAAGGEHIALVIDPIARTGTEGTRLLVRHGLGGDVSHAPLPALDPCVLRVGGEQRTVAPSLRAGGTGFDIDPAPATDALLGFSVPASAGAPSQHVKSIVAVHGADGAPLPTPAVAARIGLRAELTPLLDPTTLHAGDDLPVKLAVDLGESKGVEVLVEQRPLGSETITRTAVRTGESGVALVRLLGPGSYALCARVEVGELGGSKQPALTTLTFALGAALGGKR